MKLCWNFGIMGFKLFYCFNYVSIVNLWEVIFGVFILLNFKCFLINVNKIEVRKCDFMFFVSRGRRFIWSWLSLYISFVLDVFIFKGSFFFFIIIDRL